MIKMMTRMTAIVGLLAALPSVTNVQRAMDRASEAAARGEAGSDSSDVLGLLSGKALDPQGQGVMASLPKLLGLLSGQSTGASQPPETAPLPPATLIYNTGPRGSHGKSPDTVVMQLPPGGKAMIVDGRLQLFDPAGKPRPAR